VLVEDGDHNHDHLTIKWWDNKEAIHKG
jgi:hypothetical protein